MVVQPLEGPQSGLQVPPVGGPWIDQGGKADVLIEDVHVARFQAALTPGLNIAGHRGLRDRRHRPIQDPPVSAVRIGIEHRFQVAQAGHFVELRHPHVARIIGIDFHQGVEHPLVAGALIERHQRSAQLGMCPTIKAFRFVPLFPVHEGRPEIGPPDAVDNRIEPGADLADQRLVVQDQAQAERAVEPVGALLQRAAGGAVGRDSIPLTDADALPGVGEGGMVFVEVPGNPVARRHRPVAQPAGRLHGPGRKGKENRLDRRFADSLIVCRVNSRRIKQQRSEEDWFYPRKRGSKQIPPWTMVAARNGRSMHHISSFQNGTGKRGHERAEPGRKPRTNQS